MSKVRPKKHLGQHFLNDEEIAANIVGSLGETAGPVLEIGPGMGVLTKFLAPKYDLSVIEIDSESIEYLKLHFPQLQGRILEGDFLQMDLSGLFPSGPMSIIGNFPYNISSQILFHVLDYKDRVSRVVGMFQKEVAERIASKPGKKAYGILSVFMQAYYDVEYLFTVPEHVFIPPPKVKSGVLRCTRNERMSLDCDEKLFRLVVKTGFNQRRKTLRNALKSIMKPGSEAPFLDKRAEALSWHDFVLLTNAISAA